MKILHLSDLHLGKRIFELSMIEEQRHMLDQALEWAGEADVTVIAGDLYDRQVPPAEAVSLLSDFLTRMSERGFPVLMISGNHDSAERVAFASELMDKSGVYLSPVYDGQAKRVTFEDVHGPVHIHLLPFVKPVYVRAALQDETIEGYTQAVGAAIARMEIDPQARNVLVAHQFVTGARTSESEEVAVGGLCNVDAAVFAPFDYVALGHLHAAQSLEGGRVRYSGAPLCYAFSEAEEEKGALMVTLGKKGELDVQMRPFAPLHAVRRIRGRFAQLTAQDVAPTQDYVQITLEDEDDIPDAAGKLRPLYPNVLQILYDNARTRAQAADFSGERAPQERPMDLFAQLYAMQNGQEMTDGQRALLAGMMERIFEEDV